MPKSPTTPVAPPDAPLDLGKKRKLTLTKGLDLSGMIMFGATGIIEAISKDGKLEPVEQPPHISERN